MVTKESLAFEAGYNERLGELIATRGLPRNSMLSSFEPEEQLIRRVADPLARVDSVRGPAGQEVVVRDNVAFIAWAGERGRVVYSGGPVSVAFADTRVLIGCWRQEELAGVYSVCPQGVLQEVVVQRRAPRD